MWCQSTDETDIQQIIHKIIQNSKYTCKKTENILRKINVENKQCHIPATMTVAMNKTQVTDTKPYTERCAGAPNPLQPLEKVPLIHPSLPLPSFLFPAPFSFLFSRGLFPKSDHGV